MPLFTSPRERRLWLWAAALLAAIYASLGLAGELAGLLRERGLLEGAFGLGLLLVAAAVAAQWFKHRPGRRETWAWLGITAVYLLAWVRIESPAERTHLIEYGMLAVFIYQALIERRDNGRQVPPPALLAIVLTSLLGWLDEGIQALLPSRVYDLRDVGFNALAALMALTASLALAWVRQRTSK